MKKELRNSMLVAAATLGTAFLTGCASTNGNFTGASEPVNALAFTACTDPKELVKWSDNKWLAQDLRSADTYYFQVPASDYPINRMDRVDWRDANQPNEGMGAPSGYESSSGSYVVIRHRPGGAR